MTKMEIDRVNKRIERVPIGAVKERRASEIKIVFVYLVCYNDLTYAYDA